MSKTQKIIKYLALAFATFLILSVSATDVPPNF